MISFMFGVLGSMLFWVSFFSIGLVVGSIMIKYKAKKTWAYFKSGKMSPPGNCDPNGCEHCSSTYMCYDIPYIGIALLFVLFWPIILGGILIKIGFQFFLFPSFKKAIITAGSAIPEFEIKCKDNNKQESN